MATEAAMDFERFLGSSHIFKNKSALTPSWVPSQLLHREREIEAIARALAPTLKGARASNLFIYGVTGSGKTVCIKHTLKALSNASHSGSVVPIYLNCRVYDTRYKIFQHALIRLQSDLMKSGYSFAQLYERFLDYVEKNETTKERQKAAAVRAAREPREPRAGYGTERAEDAEHGRGGCEGRQIVFALDEIDCVKDLDSLLYTLTRINDDLATGGVALIGISNRIAFTQRLDARSRSSLCESELIFAPYNAQQLRDILTARATIAFKEGVLQSGALSLASAIAASENGDARYALALLLRAGELAEVKGLNAITEREIEAARRHADEDRAGELVSSLPLHQQLVLYALASLATNLNYKRLVENGGERYYFSSEIYEAYARFSKKAAQEPRSSRWYREYLHELETLGLLTTIESGKGIRGHATLVRLNYEPERIRQIIEKKLFQL